MIEYTVTARYSALSGYLEVFDQFIVEGDATFPTELSSINLHRGGLVKTASDRIHEALAQYVAIQDDRAQREISKP